MGLVERQPNVALDGRYTVTQTYKLLGISRSTLHNHTKAGRIKFRLRRNSKRYFYTGAEIIRYWRTA